MFYEQEQEKIFKDTIEKKLKTQKVFEKNDDRKKMEEFNMNLEMGMSTLSKYNKVFTRQEKFLEKHMETTQKFWSKISYDKPLNSLTEYIDRGYRSTRGSTKA